MKNKRLIPELYCTDIHTTKSFFINVLEFELQFERPEEKFLYLTKDGVDIMFEEVSGPGRRWITGPIERPFGRGVNFMCELQDTRALYERVKELAPETVYLPIETKAYACGDAGSITQDQFIVQDPDGYLFRFCDEKN